MRAAHQRRLRRVAVQQLARGVNLPGRGDRVDARARKPIMLLEQCLRAPEPVRVIIAVGQARQPQELVDHRLVVRQRPADRLLVWGAGVARDQLQMRFELGPAGEPELAGDHQLRVGAREAVQLR